jgi:hypothetical protein
MCINPEVGVPNTNSFISFSHCAAFFNMVKLQLLTIPCTIPKTNPQGKKYVKQCTSTIKISDISSLPYTYLELFRT